MKTGKRHDEAFGRSVVCEWEQGSEPVGIVALRHCVTVASIYRWLKRIRPGTFVQITPPSPSHKSAGLTLDWGGRVRVQILGTLSEEQLAIVFAAATWI